MNSAASDEPFCILQDYGECEVSAGIFLSYGHGSFKKLLVILVSVGSPVHVLDNFRIRGIFVNCFSVSAPQVSQQKPFGSNGGRSYFALSFLSAHHDNLQASMSFDLLNNVACPSIVRSEMIGRVLFSLEALLRALSASVCQKLPSLRHWSSGSRDSSVTAKYISPEPA